MVLHGGLGAAVVVAFAVVGAVVVFSSAAWSWTQIRRLFEVDVFLQVIPSKHLPRWLSQKAFSGRGFSYWQYELPWDPLLVIQERHFVPMVFPEPQVQSGVETVFLLHRLPGLAHRIASTDPKTKKARSTRLSE